MHQKRGLFLTLEGVEGVGKSTNIEFIVQYSVSYTHLTLPTN